MTWQIFCFRCTRGCNIEIVSLPQRNIIEIKIDFIGKVDPRLGWYLNLKWMTDNISTTISLWKYLLMYLFYVNIWTLQYVHYLTKQFLFLPNNLCSYILLENMHYTVEHYRPRITDPLKSCYHCIKCMERLLGWTGYDNQCLISNQFFIESVFSAQTNHQ